MRRLLPLAVLVFCVRLVVEMGQAQAPPDPTDFVFKLNAVQSIYQNGVPHTDRMGRPLTQLDPTRSFFPIGIYHAVTGDRYGRRYSFATLRQAGFNCVHTWEGQTVDSVIADLRANDMQLIRHGPSDDEIKKYASDPNILGWYLDEEPTGAYWGPQMEEKWAAFQKRKEEIKAVDRVHPIFVLDVPWMTPPATSWWVKWNTAGDVSSHDNYPLKPGVTTLSGDLGIPASVSLAVASNKEQKPLWFVAQAFEGGMPPFYWYMPNVREERAMVYCALIHGATGIIYFAFDSWVTRDGDVVGIAPETVSDYRGGGDFPFVASETQVSLSRTLWEGVVRLNRELHQLKPVILSPTSRQDYKVHVQGKSYSDDPIRCLLKEVNGEFTLLTVNLDKTPLWVRFEFPRRPVNVRPLFEGERKVEVKGNSWVDFYEEFGVHGYQFQWG